MPEISATGLANMNIAADMLGELQRLFSDIQGTTAELIEALRAGDLTKAFELCALNSHAMGSQTRQLMKIGEVLAVVVKTDAELYISAAGAAKIKSARLIADDMPLENAKAALDRHLEECHEPDCAMTIGLRESISDRSAN